MEEERKPWSGLAIASLAGGVLSLGLGFLMLGILAGIPAIVCGHLGRARIRKAGGMLRGKAVALAGLTMGYGGSLVWVGIFGLMLVNHKTALARTKIDVARVVQAVEQYDAEYSKLPECGAGDFGTSDPAGQRLLAKLIGEGRNGEAMRVPCFLEASPDSATLSVNQRLERGLFDAWGNPFRVILNDDFDEVLRFTYGGKAEVVDGKRVVVASKGPDGIEGTKDDVKSW